MTTDGLLLDAPAARPCPHRRKHLHGTVQAYRQDRCRCAPCRSANSAYLAFRTRQIAYGRWSAYVDGRPVRAHLKDLIDAGVDPNAIAERAHVSQGTVKRVLDAEAPRMRRRTATALLALGIGERRPANQGGLWS